MKNILEICQDVANVACVQSPVSLFGNISQNEQIFLSVAKDALAGLLRYGDWQELTKDGVLKTREGRTDYLITEFCPDFYQLLNNTVYIKDGSEKVIGSISPEQWQRDKYFHDDSGKVKFKIQNSMFRFLTPPPAGTKIVFQYRSAVIAYDQGMFSEKTELTENTDIPIFDEYLVKLAIRWRLQSRNGQNYQEEYSEYEKECKKRFGSGIAARDINLAGGLCGADNRCEGVIINAKSSYK